MLVRRTLRPSTTNSVNGSWSVWRSFGSQPGCEDHLIWYHVVNGGNNVSKKPSTDILVASDRIQQMVHVVRGQRVMLDFDLARLYGVPTSALNQAVRRNAERFPEDFAYQLTQQEVTDFDVTNCDIKDWSRWPSKTALGVHGTWGRDALGGASFANGRAGQH